MTAKSRADLLKENVALRKENDQLRKRADLMQIDADKAWREVRIMREMQRNFVQRWWQ